MNDKTSYWLEIADYDLETAKAMLETGRYLYVGFMCHQVIEKTLKAVVSSIGKIPHIFTTSASSPNCLAYTRSSTTVRRILSIAWNH